VNVLQVVVETLLFYHPAVWWISSRIRFERELCCDDEVVRATGDTMGYARALTSLERLRMPASAPALGAGGALSYRIRRLVGEVSPSRELWPAMLALVLAVAGLTVGVRWVRAQEAQDKVTVEVTRDEQFFITGVRVISGPAYLRQLALQAALQMPGLTPLQPLPPAAVTRQTFTFPAAFELRNKQSATLSAFFGDEVAQAKKNVEAIYRASPDDRGELTLAQEKLQEVLKKQALAMRFGADRQRPEKMWKVQVLRHELQAFREQYQGKLQGNSNTSLEMRYAQMKQSLAAAEKELEVLP
jgi:hypothetical protein